MGSKMAKDALNQFSNLRYWRWLVPIMAAMVAGCQTTPEPLRGEFTPISPWVAAEQSAIDIPVRWGGTVVEVATGEQLTCIEVVSRPLTGESRPVSDDVSDGRFIGCNQGFVDPEIVRIGRDVTMTGWVDEFETRLIGEFEYKYPVLDASALFIWPVATAPNYVVYYGWPAALGWYGYNRYYPPYPGWGGQPPGHRPPPGSKPPPSNSAPNRTSPAPAGKPSPTRRVK